MSEYNKQNNGGQMNRQFSNNIEKNVIRENTPAETCTCCTEQKPGFFKRIGNGIKTGAQAVGKFASNNKTATGIAAGLAITGVVVYYVDKKTGAIKKAWNKVFGKKTVEEAAPAAEAPAEEQK